MEMKVSVNRTAFRRPENFRVFTVEDASTLRTQDVEGVQIVSESGDVIAELIYDPVFPAKSGARAFLQVYDESKVRIL